jgi:hypothetical protein
MLILCSRQINKSILYDDNFLKIPNDFLKIHLQHSPIEWILITLGKEHKLTQMASLFLA